MNFLNRFLFKTSIIAVIFFPALTLKAQSVFQPQALASTHISHTVNEYTDEDNNSLVDEPVVANEKSKKELKRVLTYLKALNVPDDVNKYNSRRKFYYHLAGVFAHLKLYPLAMKCFLKTRPDEGGQIISTDTSELNDADLAISSRDDSAVNRQTPYVKNGSEIKSKRTDNAHILQLFNDGKTAIAYAMLFHVKQPVPGKRRIFKWAYTGHTFITLIKYNADSTYVSASFGFYPVKDGLLSATPLSPGTSSTFKDDSEHQWDEVLGKFISRKRFEKILALTSGYAHVNYNLNNNNCTDFGIRAASIAGIKVMETTGKWPLGSGNNPGVTGESILKGKFTDTDTLSATDLFADWE